MPAFPYTNFTLVTREDSDALFAYLRTLPAVEQPNHAHALRFPYDTQAALAVWRALFFTPGVYEADRGQSAEWNRGSYLVRGLGHCNACHGSRNVLGATSGSLEMSGGISPIDKWYAPSLAASTEAGVADWETQHIVDLLKTGVSARGSALGPMAEVVFRSTQHLDDADLRAMAVFLKSLPQSAPRATRDSAPMAPETAEHGRALYREHCEGCHGPRGEGARGAYSALAGNRLGRDGSARQRDPRGARAAASSPPPPGTRGRGACRPSGTCSTTPTPRPSSRSSAPSGATARRRCRRRTCSGCGDGTHR